MRFSALFVLALLLIPAAFAQQEDILSTPDIAPLEEAVELDIAGARPEPAELSGYALRKRLLYLNARLNRPLQARALAPGVLAANPADKETLLVMASMELERQNAAGVLHYGRKVLEADPKDDQGWFFIAAGESLLGHHSRAREILETLRTRQFRSREFPYQVDLASAALQSGDWRTALATYHEILEDRRISQPLRQEVRRIIDGIFYEHLPRIGAESLWQNFFDDGMIFRNLAAWESPFTNRIRLHARFQRDDVQQGGVGDLRKFWSDRTEGALGFTALLADTWSLRAEAGGSEAGFLAETELSRKITETRRWFVGASYNSRATDSISLEALDGRESRIYAGWDWTLDVQSLWRFGAESALRTVTVDGSFLGHGGTVEWQFERLLARQIVEVRLAYVGFWSAFNTTSTNQALVAPLFDPNTPPAEETASLQDVGINAATPETLIDPSILYQGGVLAVKREILPRWTVEAIGVFGYYIDSSQWNYGGFLRTVWYPKKSFELAASAGYLSSGTQSNSGSEVLEFSLGLRVFF